MNEVELLFTEVLNCDRPSLYADKGRLLDKEASLFVSSALKRRIKGEPIQYILGKTEFMGLEFKVTKEVFIPRPETEILVETAIKYAQRLSPSANRILELGTGSGCIAVSLAKYLFGFNIMATDISQEALDIAKENARLNNVEDKITFLKSNLFDSLAMCDTCLPAGPPAGRAGMVRCAICISNPPYIPTRDIDDLQPEIRYEPRIALDGGREGLDFYRKIIAGAPEYLKEDGFLILEMGFNQAGALKEILHSAKDLDLREIIKDYNDIERVAVLKRKKRNG